MYMGVAPRGRRGGGGWGRKIMFSDFTFRIKQGPAFYGCLKIIRTINFTIFTVYALIFQQLTAAFQFFLTTYISRSLHVVLKRPDTQRWTF